MNTQTIKSLLPNFIIDYFLSGHQRTQKAKKQIIFSFVFKSFDILLGLALVPLVLIYLGKERYGIWLVLYSITSYFSFLNIGLEQGLRNKLGEAIANNHIEKAKYYISTTYASVSVIVVIFLSIFTVCNHYINWPIVLNVSKELSNELKVLSLIIFISFGLTFILKISTTILVSLQEPSILDLNSLIERTLKLIAIILLVYTTKGTLIKMGLVYTIIPVVTLVAITIFIFTGKQRKFKPSFKYIDFSYFKDLIQLGAKFFVINIAAVVLLTTDNIIIAQIFGPEKVTPYQITHRYFTIPFILFMLIVKPLWSAITDAYTKNDINWIKNSIAKLIRIWKYFGLGILLMLISSPLFYKIWLGDKITINFLLSLSFAIFIFLKAYHSILSNFLNGIGKLNIQLYISLFLIITNIPLSVVLAKTFNLGVAGVILATSFSLLVSIILQKMQYGRIVNGKATGLWNK